MKTMTKTNRFLAGSLLVLLLGAAHEARAGRPLGTDDAGTAPKGSCQIESWHETTGSASHSLVLAPACGVAEGLELGIDYSLPQPTTDVRAAAGLALKWAPPHWQVDTGAGALSLGLKFSMAQEQPATAGWRDSESAVLALATLALDEAWNLHLNLGRARDLRSDSHATLFKLALAWEPHARWQLFAEMQTNDRREVFGETVNTTGLRWWLRKDRLGLDLTRSQATGSEISWTVGFGWYGLGS